MKTSISWCASTHRVREPALSVLRHAMILLLVGTCFAAAPSSQAQTADPKCLGETTLHGITRPHNRKIFYSNGYYYAVWLQELATPGFKPQYASMSDTGTNWVVKGATSSTENGGASGMDYQTLSSTHPLRPGVDVVALETRNVSSLGRSYQYIRGYQATGGTLTTADATLTPKFIGPNNLDFVTGSNLTVNDPVPVGYGSMIEGPGGRFWIAERDEANKVGKGANTILLYNTASATSLSMSADDPNNGNFFAFEPFPNEAGGCSTVNTERATRILTYGTWVMLVAYVPHPNCGGGAAMYFRAFDTATNTWFPRTSPSVLGPALTLADTANLQIDLPGSAPDIRPSAWVTPSGEVWVNYISKAVTVPAITCASQLANQIRTIRIVPSGSSWAIVSTPPQPELVAQVCSTATNRPLSTQIKFDQRSSCSHSAQPYVFTIAGPGLDLISYNNRLFMWKYDFTAAGGLGAWNQTPISLTTASKNYAYQSQGIPEITNQINRPFLLVQEGRGAPPGDSCTNRLPTGCNAGNSCSDVFAIEIKSLTCP